MTFVRPKIIDPAENIPAWSAVIGFADAQEVYTLEALSRAVRLATTAWPVLIVARVLLLCLPLGLGLFDAVADNLAVMAFLLTGLAVDATIVLLPRLALFRDQSPNRKLGILMPLTAISGSLFAHGAAYALGENAQPLIAAALATSAIAIAIAGRRRILGLAHALGTATGLLAASTPAFAVLPLLVLAASVAVTLPLDYCLARLRAREAPRSSLTGDQAKALLMDFEGAGRGWFWETNRNGNIIYISETLAGQLGKTAEELAGQPFTTLICNSDASLHSEGQRSLGFHLSARSPFSEIAVMAAGLTGDNERWWSVSGQPVLTPFGQFQGFRGSGSDLTEMRRSQAEIARLAKFDSLTGLANRVQMMVTLEQVMNPRRGMIGDCALLMLDLDRFKEVNDTMGHPAGDALLRQVAQRLLRIVGTDGKVGRLGGDEFQVILPGIIENAALCKLGDRIIHGLSQPYQVEGCQVVIGASIGIALSPHDGNSPETLIRNADLALYAAKGDGRGVFRFYAPEMHADAEDRRQLEHDLRQALSVGGLHLAYQPVVCASTERVTGYETLLRWDHPTRGPISPATFIPIAEEAGIIGTIGEWVLRGACAEAARWPDGIRVAVNVSPIQFANAAFPSLLMNALANAGLSANRLELEITESVFLDDGANTDGMFAALKSIGVRLALDDFGTGYSALGYLKTAPFDKIKIDQSFVRGAAIKGSRNAAIVKSIVSLAEALGMETTAEGAETLDELALIRSLGCSHIQGYVYGRPASATDIMAALAEGQGYAIAQGHKASREPRRTMLRTVTLFHGTHQYAGRVRNISPTGAMIEGLTDVPAGTHFDIELARDYVTRCSCRWSEGERMGVEFERPVDMSRVRAPIERAVLANELAEVRSAA